MNLMLDQDKANHLVAGVLAGDLAAFACVLAGVPQFSRVGAIVGAGVAGIAKEAFDWYTNRRAIASGALPTHDVDAYDFLATLCGGLLVSARP